MVVMRGSIPLYPTNKKKKIMVKIKTSYYEYEIVSTDIVDFGTSESDRYHFFRDDKYKSFLRKHRFTHNQRVFDLYLRLCSVGL